MESTTKIWLTQFFSIVNIHQVRLLTLLAHFISFMKTTEQNKSGKIGTGKYHFIFMSLKLSTVV